MPYSIGIDVSHWQGDIDWKLVAQDGIDFVYAKASEGTAITDAMFAKHAAGARAAGLPFCAYHLYRDAADPVQQAIHFTRIALAASSDWMPPMLDFEDDKAKKLGEPLALRVLRCAQEIEARWLRRPLIFTSAYYWKKLCANSPALAEHPLWAANYTTANEPLLPTPWKSWTVWQHTSKAVVWGIKGGVDRNRAKPGFVNDGGEVPRFVELTVNEKSALDLKAALDAGLT